MGPRHQLGEGGGAGDARAEPLACGTGLLGRTRCASCSCLAGPVRERNGRGEKKGAGPRTGESWAGAAGLE